MFDDLEGAFDRPCNLGRRVQACIVDDDDVVHEARNALDGAANQLRLVVRRHDNGDSSTRKHERLAIA